MAQQEQEHDGDADTEDYGPAPESPESPTAWQETVQCTCHDEGGGPDRCFIHRPEPPVEFEIQHPPFGRRVTVLAHVAPMDPETMRSMASKLVITHDDHDPSKHATVVVPMETPDDEVPMPVDPTCVGFLGDAQGMCGDHAPGDHLEPPTLLVIPGSNEDDTPVERMACNKHLLELLISVLEAPRQRPGVFVTMYPSAGVKASLLAMFRTAMEMIQAPKEDANEYVPTVRWVKPRP